MAQRLYRYNGFLILICLFFGSFHFTAFARFTAGDLKAVSPDDESMNGTALRIGTAEWTVSPRDDKDTVEAANHRAWWYVKLEGVTVDTVTLINITGDGWNGVRFAPPVYSYDRKTWIPFSYSDVTSILKDKHGKRDFYKYILKKRFAKPVVWVARYYPYTFRDLNNFIGSIRKDKKLKMDTIGRTALGMPMYMLTITDFSKPDYLKKRIFIHARTHPAESGSSFVIEGLIRYLLSKDCKVDLSSLIFNIVPMVNIDGVIAGNSRLSCGNENLEEAWVRDDKQDSILSDKAPPEVKALNSAIINLRQKGPEILAAVNLHTLNPLSYLKPFPFAFSNFSNWERYGRDGKSLWIKQTTFVKFLNEEYCVPISMRRNAKIPGMIDKKQFPESWWWVNARDSIMAITLEASPEKTCCNESCMTYDAHYKFGESIAIALQKYYNYAKSFGFGSAPADTNLEELMMYWEGVDMEEQLNK